MKSSPGGAAVAAAVALAASLAAFSACAPTLAEQDRGAVARTQADARQSPGPRQAQAYAEAVNDAIVHGTYAQDPAGLQRDAGDAIAILDSATASTAGTDAATLVAWRAILLANLGRVKEAWASFDRSMQIAPNLVAARNLVTIHGAANHPAEVGRICAATAPVIADPDQRYGLIELCMKNMNALSEQTALSWASADIVAWYQDERQRRASASAIESQREAQREAFEQRVVQRNEICMSHCKEEGLVCGNQCGGDGACERRCVGINQSCLDRCEAEARLRLGR